MPSSQLKILYLEDSQADVELVKRELEKHLQNFELKNVYNENDFVKALKDFSPDLILSDHSLPSFDSKKALGIIKTLKNKIPFVLITGTVSEEFAVQVMKEGADDYILKDRLQRLPSAILNAMDKINFENEKQKYIVEVIESEALMKEAEKIAHFGSWQIDLENNITKWSDQTYRIFGYEPGETEASLENFISNIHPDDRVNFKKMIDKAIKESESLEVKFRIKDKNGLIKYFNNKIIIKRGKENKAVNVTGFIQDITESVLAEDERNKITGDLIQQNKNLEQFAYIVSHNLRSPVANIIGFSNLLRDIELTPKEKNELTDELHISAAKLDSVIKDLNNILHIKSQITEKLETVNFTELLEQVTGSLSKLIKEENVEIKSDFSEVPEILTLKSYMYSIFFNLISNSIKYRREDINPIIEIKSLLSEKRTVLSFKDNGLGIDLKKKRGQVFGLYKRFHTHTEGKGMGLFMVKTQVETLGGKIDIKSEVNKGTEFRIEFET